MKNLISVALALIMAFSLAACGGSAQTSGSQNTQGKQDTELTKVIYIGGTLGDAGIADSTYEGFRRIVDELPVDGQYIELPTDPSAYAATLLDACDQEPAMIFTSANNGMIDEVVSAAPNYPDIKFMVLDTALSQDGIDKLDNFVGVLCAQNEVSFLTGYLAMRMSKTGKVGIVVGVEYPTLSDFITGYISGAQYANPNAQVAVSASGDFVDQAAAKETADPVSIALCHAVGQPCGTVYVETHAIGLAMYELTALVRLGLEGSAALPAASSLPCEPLCHEEITLPLSRRLETYARRLLYWEQAVNAHPGPWAPFLLKDGPNREQQRYEKQQHLKEAPPW